MTLEIGSENRVLAFLKARWLQCTVVAVLALTWWRGESWLIDVQRLDESAVSERIAADAEAAREAALIPLTVDVIVGANETLEQIFRKLRLSVTDLASLRALPDLRPNLDRLYPGELLKFSVRDAQLVSLERQLSPSETLKVRRDADGFETSVIVNPLERELRTAEATIRNSLFQAWRCVSQISSVGTSTSCSISSRATAFASSTKTSVRTANHSARVTCSPWSS
jgi:hypothetical protein